MLKTVKQDFVVFVFQGISKRHLLGGAFFIKKINAVVLGQLQITLFILDLL